MTKFLNFLTLSHRKKTACSYVLTSNILQLYAALELTCTSIKNQQNYPLHWQNTPIDLLRANDNRNNYNNTKNQKSANGTPAQAT